MIALRHLAAAALLCGTAFGATAQNAMRAMRKPFMDTRRVDAVIETGIEGGVGFGEMHTNYADVIPSLTEYQPTAGYRATGGAWAVMPLRDYLGIGTGIDLTVNNFKWNMTVLYPSQGTLSTMYARNRYFTVELPAYLQFRFNIADRVRWINEIGGYWATGLGGQTQIRSYTSATNSLGQSQVTQAPYNHPFYNPQTAVLNGYRRTDWGLHASTGLLFKRRWTLKAVLRAGVPNLANNSGVLPVRARTLNLTFKIGYQFGNN